MAAGETGDKVLQYYDGAPLIEASGYCFGRQADANTAAYGPILHVVTCEEYEQLLEEVGEASAL